MKHKGGDQPKDMQLMGSKTQPEVWFQIELSVHYIPPLLGALSFGNKLH